MAEIHDARCLGLERLQALAKTMEELSRRHEDAQAEELWRVVATEVSAAHSAMTRMLELAKEGVASTST